jgi:hypothetical protein
MVVVVSLIALGAGAMVNSLHNMGIRVEVASAVGEKDRETASTGGEGSLVVDVALGVKVSAVLVVSGPMTGAAATG